MRGGDRREKWEEIERNGGRVGIDIGVLRYS